MTRSDSTKSYYELLEVGRNASADEIEHSYQTMVETLSSDSLVVYSMLEDDELECLRQELHRAYQVLADPAARQAYDSGDTPGVKTAARLNPARQTIAVEAQHQHAAARKDPADEFDADIEPIEIIADETIHAENFNVEMDAPHDEGAPPPTFAGKANGKHEGGQWAAEALDLPEAPSQRPIASWSRRKPTEPPHEALSRDGSPGHMAPPPLPAKPVPTEPAPPAKAQPVLERSACGAEPGTQLSIIPKVSPRPAPPPGKRRFQPNLDAVLVEETEFGGATLRRLRESADATIEDIAEITKIGKRYIKAIEENDFRSLPAAVYVRGFVIEYARVLGLDEQSVAKSYMNVYRRYRDKGET